MSLNWDLSRIENFREVCYEPDLDDDGNPELDADGKPLSRLKPLTHAIILATMYLDVGEITEANWEEVAWRIRLWSATTGDHMLLQTIEDDDGHEHTESYDPSDEEVRMHVGLKVNVCTETMTKFMGKLRKIWKREAATRKARRQRAERQAEQASA